MNYSLVIDHVPVRSVFQKPQYFSHYLLRSGLGVRNFILFSATNPSVILYFLQGENSFKLLFSVNRGRHYIVSALYLCSKARERAASQVLLFNYRLLSGDPRSRLLLFHLQFLEVEVPETESKYRGSPSTWLRVELADHRFNLFMQIADPDTKFRLVEPES